MTWNLPQTNRQGERARDSQRSRVYDAEGLRPEHTSAAAKRLLYGGPKVASTGNVSIEACQAYVDHLTSSAPFQRRFGRQHIVVSHKSHGAATGSSRGINLPPGARMESTILHEVAHCLHDRLLTGSEACTGPHSAWHGPIFAALLVTLYDLQCGKEAGKALRARFAEYRVKYRPGLPFVPKPSKPVVTRAAVAKKQAAVKKEQRARASAPVAPLALAAAAVTLRRAIAAGQMGPVGSASRKAALATARQLDKAADTGTGMAASRA